MADANAAFVALASVQGALTALLAGATWYYARRTHDSSVATGRQADASAEMAREVHEQHLNEHRPFLLLDLDVPYRMPDALDWDLPKSQPSEDVRLSQVRHPLSEEFSL